MKQFILTPAIVWLESEPIVQPNTDVPLVSYGKQCFCEEGEDGFVDYECFWENSATAAASRRYESDIATALDDIMVSS